MNYDGCEKIKFYADFKNVNLPYLRAKMLVRNFLRKNYMARPVPTSVNLKGCFLAITF